MFALAREFGLQRFPSVIAGVCFSLGGVLGGVTWGYMVDSAICTPPDLFVPASGIEGGEPGHNLINAALGGFSMGMAVLAGGLHMPIMCGYEGLGADASRGRWLCCSSPPSGLAGAAGRASPRRRTSAGRTSLPWKV